ncbi:hypothetical protein NO263_00115, partial [Gluconacetobacter entanii]|nr:hypothetical protein [Gluconacetobacter entanii]
ADRQPAATTCFHTTYQAFIGLPMPAPKSFWVPPFFKKAVSFEAFWKKLHQKLLSHFRRCGGGTG